MQIELILTLLLLVGLCLLATVDMAFNQLSDVGIRRLITVVQEREKHRSSEFLKQVLEDRPRFGFAITATIQILLVVIAVLVTSLALKWFEEPRYVLMALVGALVLVWIFRQFIPMFISTRDPEGTLLFLLPAIRPVLPVMALATGPLHKLFNRSRTREQELENGVDDDDEDSGDIQALIDVGEAEGILEEEEGERIHAMIEFGETLVSEVMTPRPDIVAVPAEASVRDARDVMVESKYSRLPVYREQIDNVEGLIYVRDLMERWAAGDEEGPIAPLVREVYFVPETKPVDELLEEMQKAHVQLAMVVDEYGGVCGLVTVEDILEEIVGEIEDEDIGGEELEEIVERNGYYEVVGSTEIGKIERLFDMEIETDDFTTIAGLVINESGKVPQPGEQLKFRGLDVEVLEADERRIGRLRVKRSANGDDSNISEDR